MGMQTEGFQAWAQGILQEIFGFGEYLSKTYGSGDASLDGLATFTALVLTFTVLRLVACCNQDESTNAEFEEAAGVISEALDLASIQLSEMRYQLLTEFNKAKRNVDLVRQERAINMDELTPVPMRPFFRRSLTARLELALGDSPINQLMRRSTSE